MFSLRENFWPGRALDPRPADADANPMPRPPLSDRRRRDRRVSVYVSADEWVVLDERSAQARMPVPEFLRQRGLRDRLQIESPRRLDAQTFQELHSIGVNLNQCVRVLHRRRGTDKDLKEVLEQVRGMLHRLMPEEPD